MFEVVEVRSMVISKKKVRGLLTAGNNKKHIKFYLYTRINILDKVLKIKKLKWLLIYGFSEI